MPSEAVSTGRSFGCASRKKPSVDCESLNRSIISRTSRRGSSPTPSTTRSASYSIGVAVRVSSTFTTSVWSSPLPVDLGRVAADVPHALAADAVVELLEALAERAHVHVEDGYLGVGELVLDEVGLLGKVHAADARAVLVADRLVARAHAVDERHLL